MVFLNYSTMEMVAKIVYYGPGLGGKTTNLKTIYQKTSPQSRGEMVSLATETDRTLFFDLLPMEVGVIGGFKTKFQLYTVPGQVFYNTTRKLVLRGVDGIVFVADSQMPMMDANLESFQNMKENLAELNLTVEDIPIVLQYNKRDLPNVISVEGLNERLNSLNLPAVEASALNGNGVFETLREVSKQTLLALNNRKLSSKAKAEAASVAEAAAPPPPPPPPPPPEVDAIPEDVTFDDLPEPATEKTPKGARDSFEQTLNNLDLDLSDDDDFLEEDSLDIEEFDDWEEEDSMDNSLEEELTDDTSPGQEPIGDVPVPFTRPEVPPTLDMGKQDATDEPGETVWDDDASQMSLDSDDILNGNDEFDDDLDEELTLDEVDHDVVKPFDLSDNSAPDLSDDGITEPPPVDEDLLDEPEILSDPFEAIPEDYMVESTNKPPVSEPDPEPILEWEDEPDWDAELENTPLGPNHNDPENGTPVMMVRPGKLVEEDAPNPLAELSSPLEPEPELKVVTPPVTEKPPEVVVPKPAPEPAPLVTPRPPLPERPKRVKKAKTSSSLDELKRMTTRIHTSKLGHKKKDPSVDSLLTGVLGAPKDKKAKTERHTMVLPAGFETAQLNCVFVDGDDNVVHTELLKVKPRKLSTGKYQLRLSIDVEIED